MVRNVGDLFVHTCSCIVSQMKEASLGLRLLDAWTSLGVTLKDG